MQKVKPIIKVLRTIQKSIEVKVKEDKLFSGQIYSKGPPIFGGFFFL